MALMPEFPQTHTRNHIQKLAGVASNVLSHSAEVRGVRARHRPVRLGANLGQTCSKFTHDLCSYRATRARCMCWNNGWNEIIQQATGKGWASCLRFSPATTTTTATIRFLGDCIFGVFARGCKRAQVVTQAY